MWALYTHGWLDFWGLIAVFFPAAIGFLALTGVELGVRQSGSGRAEAWRIALAWAPGIAAVFPAGIMCWAFYFGFRW